MVGDGAHPSHITPIHTAMLLGLASVPAGLADVADCSDRGPWPCAEAGCPSPIVGCGHLATACAATFGDIWESMPDGLGSQRVWQECPRSCNRCGALWRCAWILKVSAADVVEMGVDAMNIALVQQALEQYATSNASAKPPSFCSARTNHFFEHQRRVWREQRKKAQAPTAAYSSLQQLFAYGALRWIEAARGSTGGADATTTLFQSAGDVFAWSSFLTADDCHPEHDHISSGGKSVAESDKPVVLSAVYYASGHGEAHAPLIFRDPHNGTGHDDESFSRCSYLEPSPIAAPQGSAPWSPPTETRRLALSPEPGTLYIWPGWMPHGVPQWPPQESGSRELCDQEGVASSPRVAFAANIELSKESLRQVRSDGGKRRGEDIVNHWRLPPVLMGAKFTFSAPSAGE